MTRLLFSIITLIFAISSNGQVVEDRVQKQIKILRFLHVDTLFVYSYICNGCGISADPFDTCSYEEPQFLFWIQDSKCLIQKFDYCKTYTPVSLDTANPISFYLANKNQIDKEEIKMPTYIQTKKGNITTTVTSTVDHTYYYDISFLLKGKKIFKSVSDYDLTFDKFDNGKKNMYYNYNQKTKLKALIDRTKTILTQLDTSKRFEAQSSSR